MYNHVSIHIFSKEVQVDEGRGDWREVFQAEHALDEEEVRATLTEDGRLQRASTEISKAYSLLFFCDTIFIGSTFQTVDETFVREERKFRGLEAAVRQFVRDVSNYLDAVKVVFLNACD